MTRYTSEYGHRVNTARVAAELTQTQLGELLGLTRSSIANIEAGRQGASAEQVVQTAAALNVPAPWLLVGDDIDPPQAITRAITRRWLQSVANNLRGVLSEIDQTLETP